MTKTTTAVKQILTMKRLPNSVKGNPRWQVWFTDGDVRITQSDAQVGVDISSAEFKKKQVKITLSRAGRITGIELAHET